MSRVLIVDDQPAVCKALQLLLELHQIPCLTVQTPTAALQAVAEGSVSLVIQDMNFGKGQTSGLEGIELFREFRRLDAEMPVLLITGWTHLETAVALIKEGASDYLAKPWDDGKLLASVQTLLRLRELQEENRRLQKTRRRTRENLAARHDLCGMVYGSDAMHEVVSLAVHIARADVPVLITGPSGSGKEKIAEIIQSNSSRSQAAFIKVNVGAIPDDLLESELFGSEPGAYTGSRALRIGRFEKAHQGTLFLDEIGNLSAAGQMKLLRVLQSGEFERLGSSTTRRVDVRLISATNSDLQAAVRDGLFREDLYFRLNVVELCVPPLSERSEDIVPLFEHFLAEFSHASQGLPPRLSPQAVTALSGHSWPGNVRELRNRAQRAALLCGGSTLQPSDLGLGVDDGPSIRESGGRSEPSSQSQEKGEIEEALKQSSGVVSEAAARLKLSRQALYRKMNKYGITIQRQLKK